MRFNINSTLPTSEEVVATAHTLLKIRAIISREAVDLEKLRFHFSDHPNSDQVLIGRSTWVELDVLPEFIESGVRCAADSDCTYCAQQTTIVLTAPNYSFVTTTTPRIAVDDL